MLVVGLSLVAEGQSPRSYAPIPPPRPSLSFSSGDGYVWPIDPRYARPGKFYFVVRVTVTRDATAPEQPASVTSSSFRFVDGRRGLSFSPRVTAPLGAPSLEAPCGYFQLAPNGSVTCDIMFEVPDYVATGSLEFTYYGAAPQARTIIIRQ